MRDKPAADPDPGWIEIVVLDQPSLVAYHRDAMTNPDEDLLTLIAGVFLPKKGERASLQAVPSLLGWLQSSLAAQRGMVVSCGENGNYHVWSSRNADGRKIANADTTISHHAFEQGCHSSVPVLFRDSHLDRRMRTPSETDGVQRAQWILVIPLVNQPDMTSIYIDSRFGDGPGDAELDANQALVVSLIGSLLELDLLRMKTVSVVQPTDVVEEPSKPIESIQAPNEPVLSKIGDFTTHSALLKKPIEELKRIAPTKIPVLIEGESGTGKELLARAIHQASGSNTELVVLHCGTVTESLVEIELFGNEKGAFTDAHQEREGLIDRAAGGTLLLDAIDEGSPALQAALLRVIESGRYRRVAGSEELVADFRILACASAIKHGAGIRQELQFRLAGFEIQLPPFRERPEDSLMIIDQYLEDEMSKPPRLLADAQALLLSHHWPGNGWDAIHLARRICASGLRQIDGAAMQELLGGSLQRGGEVKVGVKDVLGRAEREVILRALDQSGGNKSEACQTLGISRRTLYRRMQKHGISLKGPDRQGG